MQNGSTQTLLPEQFNDALKKGLGRAYWYITPYNHDLYCTQLLDLCTHAAAYDPANEEDRAPWIFRLLERTAAIDSYKPHIIEALRNADNLHDKRQLFRLVGEFARRDQDAFEAFCHNAIRQFSPVDKRAVVAMLLGLAQRDGLVDLAEQIGKSLAMHSNFDFDATFWATTYHDMDREFIITTLLKWIAAPSRIAAEIDVDAAPNIYEKPDNPQARDVPRTASHMVNQLFDIAQSEVGDDPALYKTWASTEAAEQDLLIVFEHLLQTDQPDLQLRLLWVFQEIPMPRLDYKVLYLAMSDNCVLKNAAVQALSNLQDAEVRNLAFRLLKIFPDALHQGALSLFFKNYESEDAAAIEDAISIPQDVRLRQALCEQILTLCQKWNEEPELTNLLLWAYENTPSSATRFKIVCCLIELDAAPRCLLEEACHDCDSMTRQFAADVLARS